MLETATLRSRSASSTPSGNDAVTLPLHYRYITVTGVQAQRQVAMMPSQYRHIPVTLPLQECKLNAKYGISCAQKMGCRVFLAWEDIAQVSLRWPSISYSYSCSLCYIRLQPPPRTLRLQAQAQDNADSAVTLPSHCRYISRSSPRWR